MYKVIRSRKQYLITLWRVVKRRFWSVSILSFCFVMNAFKGLVDVVLDPQGDAVFHRVGCRLRGGDGRQRGLGLAAGSRLTGLNHVVVRHNRLNCPPHVHAAEEEIFVVLEGEGTVLAYDCDSRPPQLRVHAVTAGDVQRVARKYLDASQLVVLVVGKAAEAEAGDVKDHPGLLKEVAPLPLIHVPLRDPLTLKPLS